MKCLRCVVHLSWVLFRHKIKYELCLLHFFRTAIQSEYLTFLISAWRRRRYRNQWDNLVVLVQKLWILLRLLFVVFLIKPLLQSHIEISILRELFVYLVPLSFQLGLTLLEIIYVWFTNLLSLLIWVLTRKVDTFGFFIREVPQEVIWIISLH